MENMVIKRLVKVSENLVTQDLRGPSGFVVQYAGEGDSFPDSPRHGTLYFLHSVDARASGYYFYSGEWTKI